jgi:hypothetical protein
MKDGKFEGRGLYIEKNGNKIKAEWKKGVKHGKVVKYNK